jgi:hypothetical protein
MKSIKSRIEALESISAPDLPIRTIYVGNEPCCDGPDEATARQNAGVSPDYAGTVIAVFYVKEPTE